MKIRIFLVLCVALFSASAFAEKGFYEGAGGEGKVIMVTSTPVQNAARDGSDSFLPAKLRENVVAGLSRYGGFSVIDLAEAKNVAQIQKQLESALYDDSVLIEAGRMEKAKQAVTVRASRLPSGSYTVSVSMFDVESGKTTAQYSSPKTFDSAESCALLAHFECVQYLIVRLDVIPTEAGKAAVAKEKAEAEKESVAVKERAEKAKKLAKQQAAEKAAAQKAANLEQMELERQRFELEERKKDAETKREREQKEYERAEEARIQAEADEQRRREEAELQEAAEARAARKAQNPFAGETYTVRIENGSNLDTYTMVFTGVSECSVTVSSLDAANRESTFTASGNYSYSGKIFSLDVIMRGSPVKHLQALHWKSAVAFKNGYGVAELTIPVSSSANAKRVKAEFLRK